MAKDKRKKKKKSAKAAPTGWKRLYNAVNAFVDAEPWQEFENIDVFMVSDPADNMMYLCSIMGNGGMEYGLYAYRGRQGMRNFFDAMEMDGEEPPGDYIYGLDMLSLSLGDKDILEKKDLAVTKKLLLNYPGGCWPLLRSFRPHYVPWQLAPDEVTALTLCLEQAVALAGMPDGPEPVLNVQPGNILVRHCEEGEWVSEEVSVAVPGKEIIPDVRLDDITLQRLRDLPADLPEEEIDLVNLPMPVKEGSRPYFPIGVASINGSGFANQYGMFAPDEDYYTESVRNTVQAFLERGHLPSSVVLREGSPFAEVFAPVCSKAGIPCRTEAELTSISDFMEEMERKMDGS